MNLFDLLDKVREFDNMTEELDFNEVKMTWNQIKGKVDYIYELLNRWESEEKRQRALSEGHAQFAKTLSNRQASLKNYVQSVMIVNKATTLPGEQFQFNLSSLKSYTYPQEAGFESFERYGNKYVKAEFKWKKKELKEDFKAGKLPDEMIDLVSESLKPSMRSGIKK